MYKFFTLFSFAILSIQLAYSQSNPTIDSDHIFSESTLSNSDAEEVYEILNYGNRYYKKGFYDKAFENYTLVFDLLPDSYALNYKLGVSAIYGGRGDQALDFLLLSNSDIADDYYYYLGRAYHFNMQFDKAKESYQNYYNSLSFIRKLFFEDEYDKLIRDCIFGIEIDNSSEQDLYIIENAGATVNSWFDDYAMVKCIETNRLFFTSRRPLSGSVEHVKRDEFLEKIFFTNYEDGFFGETSFLDELADNVNISVAGINRNDEVLYFYKGKRREGHVRLTPFTTRGVAEGADSRLRGAVDLKSSKTTSISVTDSGEVYFVSDRKGGEGGMDIWRAVQTSERRFRRAKNLGPHINTPGDEIAVHVTACGESLYFASDGHPGYGGFDIYRAVKDENGEWGSPVNLGYPVNTPFDEVFYFPASDSVTAFVSSDRPGGYGGLDIYSVKKDLSMPHLIWGELRDSDDKKVLSGRVTIIDISDDTVVASAKTDSLSGEYTLMLPDTANYQIQVDVDNYYSYSSDLPAPSMKDEEIRYDITLEKIMNPFNLWGRVVNERSSYPVGAELQFRESKEDTVVVRRIYTDSSSGFYSVTFDNKEDFYIDVLAGGYYDRTIVADLTNIEEDGTELNIELTPSQDIYLLRGVISCSESEEPLPATVSVYGLNYPEGEYAYSDSVTGRYAMELEGEGPFVFEVNADGYFFVNERITFDNDTNVIIKNIDMRPMASGSRFVVDNILFTTGEAQLRNESFEELNRVVRLLSDNPEVRIEVSGHTDNVGSAALNRRLSRQRAGSVKDYIVNQGIDDKRIEYAGYGFDRPIETNDTAEGRAANRRVEIEIID
ncbi:OmpA family protein [Marinilabiliaceae bacterium ANBcel2]|nr:OmpA family protein [Marinilabiliaceae bacterium ANBcel2]